MKQFYVTPLIEVLQMGIYLESFCMSGQDFTGKSCDYDDDSD